MVEPNEKKNENEIRVYFEFPMIFKSFSSPKIAPAENCEPFRPMCF